MAQASYSFLDVIGTISGPGGNVIISGDVAGVADGGISCAHNSDVNSMQIGADGSGMHSLHADTSGTVVVRLLKSSPVNSILSNMFDYQRTTSALWGQNTIHVANPTRGDDTTAVQCAFKRKPEFANARDAQVIEWAFDAVKLHIGFGDGTPNT